MPKFSQWNHYGERKKDSIIISNLGRTLDGGDIHTKYLRICKCGRLQAPTNISNFYKGKNECQYNHKKSKFDN